MSLKTVAEVRRECHTRKAEPEATGAPRRAAPLFRDFVEGAWKEAHFEGYKPSTRKGVQSLFDRQLLSAFSRAHPDAGDRSGPLIGLSRLCDAAENAEQECTGPDGRIGDGHVCGGETFRQTEPLVGPQRLSSTTRTVLENALRMSWTPVRLSRPSATPALRARKPCKVSLR